MANIKMSAFVRLMLNEINDDSQLITLSGIPEVGKPLGKNTRIKMSDFVEYIVEKVREFGTDGILIVDELPQMPTPDDDGFYVVRENDGSISLHLISGGIVRSLSGFEIFQNYNDIPEMLLDAGNQNENKILRVKNASDDPNLSFANTETRRQAFYRYNGVATGSIDDYTLISAPYAQADVPIKTEDTADISLTGDGTDANKLSATLQPTPNSIDIFGRTDDHWQPVVREMEEDGVRWVEVLSPDGEKLLQYSTEYFDEDIQVWKVSRNTLVNTNFDVKTLRGQFNVNALGYQAAQNSQGIQINALGYLAAQDSQGNQINALGYLAAQDSQGNQINAIGEQAARNSQGSSINAQGYQAAAASQGDNINALGYQAARNAKGDDINVFGRSSYTLQSTPKCDRVNIFGPNIQPTKSDQNIISGHEFIMPLSTPATVLAGGPKSLTTLETVEEIIEDTQAFTEWGATEW